MMPLPDPDSPTYQRASLKDGLQKLWNGEQPLSRAFWGYYFIGSILIFFVAVVAAIPFWVIDAKPLGMVAVWFILGCYAVFATIGTWRCTNRPDVGMYGVIAKVFIFLWTIALISRFMNGPAQRLLGSF